MVEDEEGYFTIYSYDLNYVLDVSGGSSANGTNIQLYENNGTNAQKFAINKVEKDNKTITNGIYEIETDNGNVINADSNQINTIANNNDNLQRWYVKYLGNGYYSISLFNDTKKCLEVYNRGKVKNTKVILNSCQTKENQKWIIKEDEEGYYNIISKDSGLYFESSDNIIVNNVNQDTNQKFKFYKNQIRKFSCRC